MHQFGSFQRASARLTCIWRNEVWLDDDDVPERVLELTKGVGCTLGLNSVGGKSALRLALFFESGWGSRTFGAMERESIRFPTSKFDFR